MKHMHHGQVKGVDASRRHQLDGARLRYGQRAWADAFQELFRADQETPLEAEDLELLAMSAYLIGQDDEYLKALERAHHAHLKAGQCARAVRCAFWLGFRSLMRGETGRATGWLSLAERLLEREDRECAERGYLLLPVVEQRFESGDFESAYGAAATRS